MNPFATCLVRPDKNQFCFHSDPEVDVLAAVQFYSRLLEQLRTHRCSSIVGPHGTGKTTLLRSIETELSTSFQSIASFTLHSGEKESGRHLVTWLDEQLTNSPAVIHTEATTVDKAPGKLATREFMLTKCIIIDGIEQLHWWNRIRIMRRICQHPSAVAIVTSHRSLFHIPIALTTSWDDGIARALTLQKMTDLPDKVAAELWQHFESHLKPSSLRSNLRDIWFSMYDRYESIRQRESFVPRDRLSGDKAGH